MRRRAGTGIAVIALAGLGCQNADLFKPASRTEDGRTFTRLDPATSQPLTSEVAYEWLDRIREAQGGERLTLVDEFLAGPTAGEHELRVFLPGDDHSDAALVLHVFEELFQHLGHMQVTADAVAS